jgi:hypothetical protein
VRILCTHPGRYGDLLWALPTVRALSFSASQPIDLLLSPKYSSESFRSLLARQLYIGSVIVANDWEVLETAPMTPRVPPSLPSGYDQIVHLAYEGWPSLTLPYETYRIAGEQVPIDWPLSLDVPWIAAPYEHSCNPYRLAVGFSDEHFELKYGLYWLLRGHFVQNGEIGGLMNVCGGPRWSGVGHNSDWEAAASWIAQATVFVGCCSALHVLACAAGTPVVLLEPNPMRHHDVFYPFGKCSEVVRLVTGLDGQPTFDSRHLIDAVETRLAGRA